MSSFIRRAWAASLLAVVAMSCTAIGELTLSGKPSETESSSTTTASGGGASTTSSGHGGHGGSGGQGGTGGQGGGCASDKDCNGSPLGPVCDPAASVCVACLPSDDLCPVGEYCAGIDDCEAGCRTDADCVGASPPDGGALTCDVATHVCHGCSDDGNCPHGTVCDLVASACVPGCTPQQPCQQGRDCCGSTCADLSKDVAHCGACDAPCAPDNALGKCSKGKCTIAGCNAGFKDCNALASDGCETSVTDDANNCGACNKACSGFPFSTPACSSGVCVLGACAMGYGDCDGDPIDGCEVHLTSSAGNCGSCANVCAPLHANGTCSGGTCTIGSCAAGFANCDMSPANGCEVNTQTDVSNCGQCGMVCSYANAAPVCNAGSCAEGACAAPFAECNLMPGDGCETNTQTDVFHCGMCGHACSLTNANAMCSGGACAVQSCKGTFADCDGDPTNGCESNLQTDKLDCGSCGAVCSTNNGTPTCSSAKCSIACNGGFADCDMNAANGCEINTNTNVQNCGSCGHACPAMGGSPTCVNGNCGVAVCLAGKGDCDGNAANGCEATLSSDPNNCGACGVVCFAANGTAACNNGMCAISSCNPGFADCDLSYATGCETSLHTNSNCGGCGTQCTLQHATTSCATGTCSLVACTAPYGDCDNSPVDGCETDTSSSIGNCGGCGHACSSKNGAPSCTNSACSIQCNPGFGDCDGNVATGCETPFANNPSACGSCGNVCAVQNGTPACNGSTCAIQSCNNGFADCDNMYSTGCEVNLQTDARNCGGCGEMCNAKNASSATCMAGACVLTCNQGFADCNGVGADGCETFIGGDVQNCGGCGRACDSSDVMSVACAGGICKSTCDLGFGNCSQPLAPAQDDGCEADVSKDSTRCGSCSNSCKQQGKAGNPFVCDPNGLAPDLCGCDADVECGIGIVTTCDLASGKCLCNGATCNYGEVCKMAGAVVGCACNAGGPCLQGSVCCVSGCVDITKNPSSCGACGRVCPPGFTCGNSKCLCKVDLDCNAGTPGTCSLGSCKCGNSSCGEGERCLPNGKCG